MNAATPWECYRCDRTFTKRTLLRKHENEAHCQVKNSQSIIVPKKRSSKSMQDKETEIGIIIPKIQSSILDAVIKTNQIPFAVLHFLQNVPMLVRIINHGTDKHLLRAVTQGDIIAMKRHSQKMSIAVVASIHQCLDANGRITFSISPPQSIYENMSNERQIKLQFLDTNANIGQMLHELKRMQTMQNEEQQRQVSCVDNEADISIPPPKIVCRSISLTELQSDCGNDMDLRVAFENIGSGQLLSPKKKSVQVEIKFFSR